jgi:hypothetical protein
VFHDLQKTMGFSLPFAKLLDHSAILGATDAWSAITNSKPARAAFGDLSSDVSRQRRTPVISAEHLLFITAAACFKAPF